MSLLQSLDDRLNPIVVKELRQAVKGRFIVGVFSLFLVISLITVVIFLIDSQDRRSIDYNAGRDVFLALQGILAGTCLLFLPIYAAVRFASERSDVNVDLLFITTIPPRAVIWGKFLATTILAGILYSACMPFMMLTYLMRGIDLPSITVLLSYSFAIVLVSIGLGIFSACLTSHRGFRVIVGLGLIFCLIWGFMGIIAPTEQYLRWGMSTFFGGGNFWSVASTFLVLTFCAIWLLFAWSVALIKPPSVNRALGVRISMMAVWLIGFGLGLGFAIYTGAEEPMEMWAVISATYLSVYFPVAICERESWGPRVRRTIPKNFLSRIFAFLLYSGAAGGILWAVSLHVLTVAGLYTVLAFSSTFGITGRMDDELQTYVFCFPLYILCYSLLACWIHRQFLTRYIRQEHAWVIVAVVAAVLCLLPPVLGFVILGFRMDDSLWWTLPSPIALGWNKIRDEAIMFISVSAILCFGAALPWMVRQWIRFKPQPVDSESGVQPRVSSEMAPFADLDHAIAADALGAIPGPDDLGGSADAEVKE